MAIIYKNVRNPRYADAGNGSINVEVTFEGLPDFPGMASMNGVEVSFCAMPNDREKHGQEIYQKAAKGDFGPVAPYVKP